jgi:hypothetical protein
MLFERISQTGKVPEGTKEIKVRQLMAYLVSLLIADLQRSMTWLAVCTVAVDAGYRKAEKIKARRQRLLDKINICRSYLKEPLIEMPEGWLEINLTYGYGAVNHNNIGIFQILQMAKIFEDIPPEDKVKAGILELKESHRENFLDMAAKNVHGTNHEQTMELAMISMQGPRG